MDGDDQDQTNKQELGDFEAEQKRKDESAHLSELAHQKRIEAARLEAEAEEAESRQTSPEWGVTSQDRNCLQSYQHIPRLMVKKRPHFTYDTSNKSRYRNPC